MNQALEAGHEKRRREIKQREMKWRMEAIRYLEQSGAVSLSTAVPATKVPYSDKRSVAKLVRNELITESNGRWHINQNPPKSLLYKASFGIGKCAGNLFRKIRS